MSGLRLVEVRVVVRQLVLLRRVTLEVPRGTVVALVGRNGAGKTTTMRAIMGLVPIAAGAVALNGTDLRARPAHHRATLGVGYMPEDRRLIPQLTVEENLLVPVWANRLPDGRERLQRVYDVLPGVRAFAPRRAGQLSGGQQKLVALARALMVGDEVLLLDEPFEGLAPALVEQIAGVLQRLAGSQTAVLVAESELLHVGRLAARTYTIERGEIVGVQG
ncbi:MAG: ATP-binding cassette domain-containing protein [Armatimonadota bacterium]|nr:ATP-binding cassette domain-containing protein [Armatimonadota bacterium]